MFRLQDTLIFKPGICTSRAPARVRRQINDNLLGNAQYCLDPPHRSAEEAAASDFIKKLRSKASIYNSGAGRSLSLYTGNEIRDRG
jgi:hypothetical protein